jgi:hypothetical protein
MAIMSEKNAEWAKKGAHDGLDFYDSVDGDIKRLSASVAGTG